MCFSSYKIFQSVITFPLERRLKLRGIYGIHLLGRWRSYLALVKTNVMLVHAHRFIPTEPNTIVDHFKTSYPIIWVTWTNIEGRKSVIEIEVHCISTLPIEWAIYKVCKAIANSSQHVWYSLWFKFQILTCCNYKNFPNLTMTPTHLFIGSYLFM